MSNIKKILSAVSVLFLAACASAPQVVVEPFDTTATLESSFDDTWAKAVRFLSTNQIGIKTIEKDSGLIVLENTSMSPQLISEYCVVNIPFMSALDSGKASGNLTVVSEGGFTTASVNLSFSATTKFCYEGCNYTTNRCTSKGRFETQLLDALQ